jgi:hypothetical protein
MDMSTSDQPSNSNKAASLTKQDQTALKDFARIGASQADESSKAEAVPSNTATNNCISEQEVDVKFLRWGVDSLYLSYQGNITEDVDKALKALKLIAQSERKNEQAKAQYVIGDHIFEVKDKGSSFFTYILEDNAFRIQLSRPNKAVPMAYVKISSEYLTYKTPADAELALRDILKQLGNLESSANVSRIDLFLDFASSYPMDSWDRHAWVTRASAVSSYAIDNEFTGWAIGQGSVISGRLYNKITEIIKSQKGYLIPLWKQADWDCVTPIWRLEFQYKREFLDQKEVVKLADVLQHLNGLWSYATTEWLKLTIPNPDDKTRSRWPIHPLWVALSSVDWETSGGALKSRFQNDRPPKEEALMNRAVSAVTTWMAAHEYRDYELAIHPFFIALEQFINNKSMDFGQSFEEFINEKVSIKARLFNTMDNTDSYDAEAYRRESDGE